MTPSSLRGWRLSELGVKNVEQSGTSALMGRAFRYMNSTFLNASHLSRIRVSARAQISSRRCQSVELRASRETSSPSTIPARPRLTSVTRR